jgi:hypothetical protein
MKFKIFFIVLKDIIILSPQPVKVQRDGRLEIEVLANMTAGGKMFISLMPVLDL